MRIFVIGFQRSGTTLTRRIFHNHPDVSLLHEQKTIKRGKTKEQFLKYLHARFPKVKTKKHWGDKMPWYDNNGKMIIGYAKKWADFFENEARIIHVVRHPLDVAKSTVRLRWAPNLERPIKFHSNSVPNVLKFINDDERFISIRFEDLVMHKEEKIVDLFEFCNIKINKGILKQILEADYRYFEGINADRAFAYKKEKMPKIKITLHDYDKMLKDAKLL